MKVGICGLGGFSASFVPLYLAHPDVSEVVLADVLSDRVEAAAKKYGVRRTLGSLDELCASDVDAIVILTQRHLHGPQAVQALRAGKHVYSAVPAAMSMEQLNELVETVERTGQIYMTGETSYYYPSTIYCRKRFAAGDFGKFVYAESQYHHDMDHFYAAYQRSGGPQWQRVAGIPPMYYPTHTLSMILAVTGAVATSVSCMGYRDDDHPDNCFGKGKNNWDNPFSNESALMRTSDGGVIRINEMRRIGWLGGNCVYMSFYGTDACFEENTISSCWATKDAKDLTDLTRLLDCYKFKKEAGDPSDAGAGGDEFYAGVSQVHPVERLPETFRTAPNGHYGSHQFLVDDFVRAARAGKHPPCHVWNAANWLAPGLIAHESALRDGEMMKVPTFEMPKRLRGSEYHLQL